jgi:hypothetical protein
MRTLSPLADAERQRAVTGWLPVLTLTLWRDRYGSTPASLTLYASDVTRYLSVDGAAEAREYLGLVLTWGTLGDSLEALNPATAPASVDLTLSNQVPVAAGGLSVARFTDLLREGTHTDGYDPGGADCTIAWLPPGGTIGRDDVILYIGRLDVLNPVDEATVRLQSTSLEGGATIPIRDAAVIGESWSGLGSWWEFGQNLKASLQHTTLTPPLTCAMAVCYGPPSFDTEGLWADATMLVDYTRTTEGDLTLFEQVYAGFYRAASPPATVLTFTINTTSSGRFEAASYVGPVILEVVTFIEPASLAEVQGQSHDTIAGRVSAVLATIASNTAGPHSIDITGHSWIGWRLAAASFPSVPAPIQKNYSEIDLLDITVT